jgi:hypothetical protein
MQKEFDMFILGELSLFLGLQITQTRKGIFFAQTQYIKETLKKFEMEYCKHISKPMVTRCKLNNEDECNETNQSLYRSMSNNLLYVTTSRQDIIQAIGIVGIFQVTPKETHVLAIK